jgi:carboxyl-terminal processing protease
MMSTFRVLTAAGLVFLSSWATPAKEFTPAQSGRITQVVAGLLEAYHLLGAPLDDTMAERFLKNYFDALDYNHMIFLQSDVDEFTRRYGDTLDEMTKAGIPKPAFDIFARYLERLQQRQQWVEELLDSPFDFTKEESYQPSRNKEPWPKDDAEARDLWRRRIKGELLQDRVAKQLAALEKAETADTARAPATQPSAVDAAAPPRAADAKATDPGEAIETIRKRYRRLLRTMKEFDTEEILSAYLGALARAYDPHSGYMGPTEVENFEITNVRLSLTGIGASLSRNDDGYTEIVRLIAGGPADLSKQLKPKDRIIAVAQGDGEWVDVIDEKLAKVVQMIRGPKGTEVRLRIIPGDAADGSERKEVRLIRDEVKLEELHAKARLIEYTPPDGQTLRLGVIVLPEFYERTTEDVEKLIARLKEEGVAGLILDLRRNGGGLLHQAIGLTGLFVNTGPVVQVKETHRRPQVLSDEEAGAAFEGPLVVLVNHLSASASEIVAAALQDYGRAVIVGDQTTHGKGTVQQLLSLDRAVGMKDLPNPGKLKLTVSKFYRIAGGTTQKHGVTPDVVLPSVLDHMELGEASLPNCLEADRIPALDYPRSGRVGPLLDELRRRSTERLQQSEEFRFIQEDIDRLKAQKQTKTVSLNETERVHEKLEEKHRLAARKAARSARKDAPYRVLLLSLENAEKHQPLTPLAQARAKDAAEPAAEDDTEDTPDAQDPRADPYLAEALNVLTDLTHLLAKNGGQPLADTKPALSPPPGSPAPKGLSRED